MSAVRSLFVACLVASVLSVHAQKSGLEGKYQGSADIRGVGKIDISADIRESSGKLSGVVHSPLGDAEIIRGRLGPGQLSITLDAGGDDVLLNGKVSADRAIIGDISSDTLNGTFELKRIADLPPDSESQPVIHQSKDKWRDDLHYLAAELPKRHKNAFHRICRADWNKLAADLDRRIPALSDEEIVLEMGRIVSRVGDGHTWLRWTHLFPRIPLRLFWFGKELRVIQVSKDHPELTGARITKINGHKVKELYEASRAYISPGESEEFVLNTNPYLITFPVFLKAIGAGRSDDNVELEFIDLKGHRASAVVPAPGSEKSVEWLQACKGNLLYLQQPDQPLFFKHLKDFHTVYVNFRSYPRRAEFKKFSGQLLDLIDKTGVDKLIFDFRQNGGGDFTRGREFFVTPLKSRKRFLERGHLLALTGRRTFSAGMTNVADLRNDLNAILVGEPTGARPNGYQENRSFILPNSHLSVSYSTELYNFSKLDTAGIVPDKLIVPSWRSCRDGRDEALEWALAFPALEKN